MREVAPYSVLAVGYDVVMQHVDYDFWAAYILERIHRYHPAPRTVLELGCGTGSFALAFVERSACQYLGTDGVAAMVHVARAKADLANAPVQFEVADFTDFRLDGAVDVVLLLYDGLNYLLDQEAVQALFRCAYAALAPGGLFIFDQSTPVNSINNEAAFEDDGEVDLFSYRRSSRYDRSSRLHTTTFDLVIEGEAFQEQHVQRAYAAVEIEARIRETAFETLAAYDGFSEDPANEASERIHWVLRRPTLSIPVKPDHTVD